ncbi:MAG: diguanylate cyclase with sensor [Rhodoferax sp.]|nr:diguanylate cyclase with sensor [Rhodoferax sp.]
MATALQDIAEEYEALVQFLYLAPVGLVQANLDGEIAMINPLSAQLLIPLSPDGNLSNLFQVLQTVAPDLRHLVESCTAPHGMLCDGVRIPLAGSSAARPQQPTMLSLTLLKLDQQRLMAVVNDITQQVARERLLQQNEAWLNAIMVGVTEYALVRLDHGGRIHDWNASIGRITGFSEEAVVGQPFSVFYPDGGTTVDRIADRLREADESGWSLDEGWRLKADGSRFWGSAMITPLDLRNAQGPAASACVDTPQAADAAAPAYSLVIRDITDKREASESQRKAIACDHLTGIGNRRSFFEAAELEFLRGKRLPRKLSLLMLDLDHFKRVNDGHGHPAGDAVLRDFAALLTASFREVDVVCRLGGEEFAVLMPSADLAQAQAGAERLRQRAEMHAVVVDGVTIRYTVSGGIAMVDSDAADLDTLMKRADMALYAAKAEGRNRVAHWRPTDAARADTPTAQP